MRQGLSIMNAPSETVIAFSCAAGEATLDETGNNRNGIFTENLLKYIAVPNKDIEEVLKRVSRDVKLQTGGFQKPYRTSSLTEDVFLVTNHSEGQTLFFVNSLIFALLESVKGLIQGAYQPSHSTISAAAVSKTPITTSQISTESQIKQNEIQTGKNQYKQFGITVAGGNGEGQKLNQLYCPTGMFIDNDKSIYIADSYNHRIVKWKLNSNTGQIIAGGNGKGNQNNQLNWPTNIIFDKQNNSFIISDQRNNRVIRYFDQNQTNQQIIISNIGCWDLTIDKNGFVYVSDCWNHEVRRWKQGDDEGELVAGGNGKGNHLNQLNFPTFIFIDEDYSLYISDRENHRVMKWEKDAKEGIIVAGGNGRGRSLKQLWSPEGVIVDHLGQIYVADLMNHRVMRWCEGDKEGEIVVGRNGQGNQSNQLNYSYGLSFDDKENLYVVDCGNHRIQKHEKL
ncbi:unnamed protein product [Adineta steineri]|uniref:Peptidase C14 caspase domain-containing protein n=1 Tax=Adineta steineri TaxID=433720 RepID=A0A814MIK6_9BILA|nr:unnamed protein product [Adineta steineri]CAF1078861.1 unnamed protein product [Adineta steineri]